MASCVCMRAPWFDLLVMCRRLARLARLRSPASSPSRLCRSCCIQPAVHTQALAGYALHCRTSAPARRPRHPPHLAARRRHRRQAPGAIQAAQDGDRARPTRAHPPARDPPGPRDPAVALPPARSHRHHPRPQAPHPPAVGRQPCRGGCHRHKGRQGPQGPGDAQRGVRRRTRRAFAPPPPPRSVGFSHD